MRSGRAPPGCLADRRQVELDRAVRRLPVDGRPRSVRAAGAAAQPAVRVGGRARDLAGTEQLDVIVRPGELDLAAEADRRGGQAVDPAHARGSHGVLRLRRRLVGDARRLDVPLADPALDGRVGGRHQVDGRLGGVEALHAAGDLAVADPQRSAGPAVGARHPGELARLAQVDRPAEAAACWAEGRSARRRRARARARSRSRTPRRTRPRRRMRGRRRSRSAGRDGWFHRVSGAETEARFQSAGRYGRSAQVTVTSTAVTSTFRVATGRSTFQPRLISWS